jgi:hypothetical protein
MESVFCTVSFIVQLFVYKAQLTIDSQLEDNAIKTTKVN